MVRVGEVAEVVNHPDDALPGGQAAGGVDPAVAVAAHLQVHGAGVLRRELGPLDIHQELVRHHLTDLLVAVAAGVVGDGHHAALLQLADVGGQRAVGDMEPPGQLVHVHGLLHQEPHDLQPDLGPQGLEEAQAVAELFDMEHGSSPPSFLFCQKLK